MYLKCVYDADYYMDIYDSDECFKINPCLEPFTDCKDTHAQCYPQTGTTSEQSQTCQCPFGLIGDGNVEHGCIDFNECDLPGYCDSDEAMVCHNYWFGYECACLNGFRMVSHRCVDIDECVENEPCDDACENLEGSFRCSCKRG